jgi:hypothetical protein
MFLKNQYKKINNILLIIFISNLVLGGLFLAPIQIQAAYSCDSVTQTCHSCNAAGQCVDDPNNPYWCAQCFSICSKNTTTNPQTGEIITNLENVVDTISDIHGTIGAGSTQTIIGLITENIVDVDYICTMLANAATALPFGAGYALATAITLTCPKILHEILDQLGFYKEKFKTGESTQIIPVPSLESYTWEVGIPGFIKPGQSTEFK